MEALFGTVKRACQEFSSTVLEEIFQEFQDECEDPVAIGILDRIIRTRLDLLENGPPAEEVLYPEGCHHLFVRGKNRGKRCGSTLALNNQRFCQRHAPKGCDFVLTRGPHRGDRCGKSIAGSSLSGRRCRAHLKSENTNQTRELILEKNQWNQMEHIATGLIFEDKRVCGRKMEGGVVSRELTDDDFECVLEYGFRLSPYLKPAFRAFRERRRSPENLESERPQSPRIIFEDDSE